MIPWSEIDTLFLDMDGTLLDLHFDDEFWQHFLPQRYADKHQLTLQHAHAILQPKFKAKEGTLDWYCLDYWTRELELDIPALKQELAHLIAIHDGVETFLAAMKPRTITVVLLTNAHGSVLSLKMAQTGLAKYFDHIITSHDVGCAKEQANFWQKLTEHLPFNPNSSLFIDDSLPVLRAAREQGVKHLLSIEKPSSSKPARNITEFPTLKHFADLIPG